MKSHFKKTFEFLTATPVVWVVTNILTIIAPSYLGSSRLPLVGVLYPAGSGLLRNVVSYIPYDSA
jgi:hypothetical protein